MAYFFYRFAGRGLKPFKHHVVDFLRYVSFGTELFVWSSHQFQNLFVTSFTAVYPYLCGENKGPVV